MNDLSPGVPPPEADIIQRWSDSDLPKVTVICNVFNHAKFVEDALSGILSQKTSFPFDVVVHDDASTDGSQAILQGFAARYPRIVRLILQDKNRYSEGVKPTPGSMATSTAEYFALCEGDDFWIDESKLQTQVDFLEANPVFSACSSLALVLESGHFRRDPAGRGHPIARRDVLAGDKTHCRTCTLLFRRAAVSSKWPEEVRAAYAFDNFLRYQLTGWGPIKVIPQPMSCYRAHPGGVWSSLRRDEALRRKIHDLTLLSRIVEPGEQGMLRVRIALCRLQASRPGFRAVAASLRDFAANGPAFLELAYRTGARKARALRARRRKPTAT